MATLYLVSCVGMKRNLPARAKDLYVSPWFLKARQYVEARSQRWRILSAKHGVVEPDAMIEPYNETLNTMSVRDRKAWSERVLRELRELAAPGDTVVFLAGARYREFLIPALATDGVTVEVPMEGLRIGKQLQWLDTFGT